MDNREWKSDETYTPDSAADAINKTDTFDPDNNAMQDDLVTEDMVAVSSFPPARSQCRVESVYEWAEMAVFALTAVVLLFAFLFRVVSVDGDSMNPTLLNGQRLIVTSTPYTPQAGDIVIINRYVKEPLVKRIIAVGGDTLTIDPDTNEVAVNGTVLDESYIQGITEPLFFQPTTQTVPEGYVFVMGDNREHSSDSRYTTVGFIQERDIVGKAVYRIFPFNVFGGLYS